MRWDFHWTIPLQARGSTDHSLQLDLIECGEHRISDMGMEQQRPPLINPPIWGKSIQFGGWTFIFPAKSWWKVVEIGAWHRAILQSPGNVAISAHARRPPSSVDTVGMCRKWSLYNLGSGPQKKMEEEGKANAYQSRVAHFFGGWEASLFNQW